MTAQKDQIYELLGKRVVALSTGDRVTVADLSAAHPLGGQRWIVDSKELTPTGMRMSGAHGVSA